MTEFEHDIHKSLFNLNGMPWHKYDNMTHEREREYGLQNSLPCLVSLKMQYNECEWRPKHFLNKHLRSHIIIKVSMEIKRDCCIT